VLNKNNNVKKMLKIYALVVTYNGKNWIKKCLKSIENSIIPIHIIVIDNNSTDNTIEIIEKEFSNVELIKSDINLGFGKGNNIGLEKALEENADYVFLLNQDAWIEPDTIEKLTEVHKKNQNFGILSPFHLDYEKKKIEYYFSTIISPSFCPNLINDLYFNTLKEIYEIDFIHAAAWLISKECLQATGGFDPIFPHYGEDNDYVNRVKYHKFNIGICPTPKVYHYGTNDGLNNVGKNFKMELNFNIIKLKSIKYKFPGLFLVFLKNSHDKITSALLYRRFKDLYFNIKLFLKTISLLSQILKQRKICKKETAFLKLKN